MQYKAQIGKILFNDALSLRLLLAVVIAAGMLAAAALLILALPVLVIAAALLVSRVGLIRNTLEGGALSEGILASKRRSRRGWELWYVFRGADDQMHRVRNITVRGIAADEGETVSIAYDPEAPQRAFLADLYGART